MFSVQGCSENSPCSHSFKRNSVTTDGREQEMQLPPGRSKAQLPMGMCCQGRRLGRLGQHTLWTAHSCQPRSLQLWGWLRGWGPRPRSP